MGSQVKCFMIWPSGQVQLWLRRYVGGVQCPSDPMGYHQGWTLIDVEDELLEAGVCVNGTRAGVLDDDPRWPTHCSCGLEFSGDTIRQVFVKHLYKRDDNGELVTLNNAPPGAMWDVSWYHGIELFVPGPEGMILSVMTPGGEWVIDGPSSSVGPDGKTIWGPRWTRTGIPPNLTVNPSIAVGSPIRYHGWLRNGILIEC